MLNINKQRDKTMININSKVKASINGETIFGIVIDRDLGDYGANMMFMINQIGGNIRMAEPKNVKLVNDEEYAMAGLLVGAA